MTTEVAVSVVIPCHNAAATVAETIRSALAQEVAIAGERGRVRMHHLRLIPRGLHGGIKAPLQSGRGAG